MCCSLISSCALWHVCACVCTCTHFKRILKVNDAFLCCKAFIAVVAACSQWATAGWTFLYYPREQVVRVFTGLPCCFGRDMEKRESLKPLGVETKKHRGDSEGRMFCTGETANILHTAQISIQRRQCVVSVSGLSVGDRETCERTHPMSRLKSSFANAGREAGKIPHAFTIKGPCHRKEFAVSLG